MDKIEYCYHTHTSRCGHAYGKDEEFVLSAIKAGIKRLGFSDHIFFPNIVQPTIRGSYDQLDDYLNSIHSLKEKYKNQIDIIVGFEAEYGDCYLDYYKWLIESKKIDYLIMGQHYLIKPNHLSYYSSAEDYVTSVEKGLDTGLFKYIAHPDIFVMFNRGWDSSLEPYARRILKKCEETNTPIEINILGLRGKRLYPNDEFFELAREYNVKVVVGVDAHEPNQFSKEAFQIAIEFAKKHHLEIIDFKI